MTVRILVPALLALLAAAPAAAQRPPPLSVAVTGAAEGWRPVVRVDGVLQERALRDALDAGLPLRFHFRLELWRRDVFDRPVASHEASRALLRRALEEGYVIEDARGARSVRTLEEAEAVLREAFGAAMGPREAGRYYYLAALEVETLSLSDLDELRRWLRGEARPAVEGRQPVGRAVERGLRRTFVRLLRLPTRSYRARTEAFTVPAG